MTVLTDFDRLEAESIHILREVVAEAARPVMLYSIGKDSAVMLHLAKKAFFPSPPPFPLLHIDTTWKFRAMYDFRDRVAADSGMEFIVHTNADAKARGINPFDHAGLHTDLWKTVGLKQALDAGGYDAAFGGARRDEENSRAKERIFSFRSAAHGWDPKNQRPELWNLYNARIARGESIRVFPLSNWTELDVWRYIAREGIEVPDIYYAHEREVFERDGMLLGVTPHSMPRDGEVVSTRTVRYRTVGDASCTGAVASLARTPDEVVTEVAATRITERGATRADDRASEAAMEDRKKEGYF